VAMVGLLYALPNTQLTRRLAKEGRLHALTMTSLLRPEATNAPRASTSTLCGLCETCSEITGACWTRSISQQPMPRGDRQTRSTTLAVPTNQHLRFSCYQTCGGCEWSSDRALAVVEKTICSRLCAAVQVRCEQSRAPASPGFPSLGGGR
jgi:hypothetical protein